MDAREEADHRLTAFGNQLIEVHIWLREQMEDLRENVDAYLNGSGPRPRDLRVHCLSFCSALTRHHTGEDGDAFSIIAEQFPELRKVISDLKTDHHRIDWILGNLEKLISGLEPNPDAYNSVRIREELDGLSAIMQTHFIYEEKKLVPILNSMEVPQWRKSRPDFLLFEEDDG